MRNARNQRLECRRPISGCRQHLSAPPGDAAPGTTLTIGILDVHYRDDGARAACVVIDDWEAAAPAATYAADIEAVQPYQAGSFFLRELPCLLAVLRLLPSMPAILVVDGYVWLPPSRRPGLGAHLHEALQGSTPVVGIAKTAFFSGDADTTAVPVLRGTSRKPLYVTAIGADAEYAARSVQGMAGQHRIPEMLRITDRLSRGIAASSD